MRWAARKENRFRGFPARLGPALGLLVSVTFLPRFGGQVESGQQQDLAESAPGRAGSTSAGRSFAQERGSVATGMYGKFW